MKRNSSSLQSSPVCPDFVSSNTRSKRPKLVEPLDLNPQNQTLISATQTKNYLINDPLVDFLNIWVSESNTRNSHSQYSNKPLFKEFIMNRGKEFESELIKYINNHKIPVISVSEVYTLDMVQKTIDLMKAGTPLIHSAPLHNKRNNTGGIADLLVRSDYLDKLVDDCPLEEDDKIIPAPKLKHDFHYVVIDIKFSTLPLCADGQHLRNDGFYRAYKSQLYIYNQAIGAIQGYTSPYAYILGRRWKYTTKGETYLGYSCLEKVGVVDFNGFDSRYSVMTKDAIKWCRDVRQRGHTWSLNPPSRIELYPNLCVDSGEWNKYKEELAQKLGDITMLWFCGPKQRQVAFRHGVKSWKDSNCSSRTMGMNGVRASTIDKIININRQNEDLIRPLKITNNLNNWKTKIDTELYVDFETFCDIFTPFSNLPYQKPQEMFIYLIGVGWMSSNGVWNYKSFIAKTPTLDEEFRVMDEFVQFVDSMNNPPLYYWHAEDTMWDKSENHQFDNQTSRKRNHIAKHWQLTNWTDLSQLFKSEPIVIKNCFNYGLKHIAKAMREHGMIDTRLESDCTSGLSAMVKAQQCYDTCSDPPASPIMKDIEEYNKYDCRVLYDILEYLRNNHV